MKYALFAAVCALGVPLVAWAAWASAKWRGHLVSALLVSAALGDLASINFLSMETYRGPDRGFEVTLTDLLALGLAVALAARFPTRLRWWPTGSTLLWLLFAVAAASVAWAPVPMYGGFALFKLARAYVVFWVVANAVHTGTPTLAAWRGLALMAGLVAVVAMKQKYLDGIYRVPGPFDHSNTIPLYANLVMPVLFVWSVADRGLSRAEAALGTLAALGLMAAVIATFSRAGTALAALGLLAALVLVNRGRPTLRVRAVSALVVIGALAGGVMAADSLLARARSAPESSEEARHEFNEAADLMLRDHPLGIGLNNFSHVLTVEDRYRDHITVMANEEQAGVAHHIYRLTAAELGYPGLLLFVAMLAQFAWVALSAGWRRRRTPDGRALLALGIGMLTLHAAGLLEWGFRITPVTYQFAIVAGLAAGLAGRLRPTSNGAIRPVAGRMATAQPIHRQAEINVSQIRTDSYRNRP